MDEEKMPEWGLDVPEARLGPAASPLRPGTQT